MKRKVYLSTLIFLIFVLLAPLQAGERDIPVDFFLLIDKSLSMAEDDKFPSMREWVQKQLLEQMLITGDWVSIWQFYGKTEELLTLELKTETDRTAILNTFGKIKPNGEYTDIGTALDTIKAAVERRKNPERLTILYLLTDLKQEAPWSSRYAGNMDKFESPYLAEARTIIHENWYEITLDMDIQDKVVETSKSLYLSIVEAGSTRETGSDSELQAGGEDGTSTVSAKDTPGNNPDDSEKGNRGALPIVPIIVIISLVLIAAFIIVYIRSRQRKDDKQDTARQG